MKTLIKKFCVFLTPFILIIALFFMFNPYNYLGLRSYVPYDTLPLSSMRELIMNQPDKIILGDSRMANLSTDYIKEVSGEDYTMLGFGGANVGHCIELFWFATENTQLTKVVFGIGWYTSNGEQGPGDIPTLEKSARDPLGFLSGYYNWTYMFWRIRVRATNAAADLLGLDKENTPWVEPEEDPRTLENIPVYYNEALQQPYHMGVMDHSYIVYANLTELEDGYELRDDTLRQLAEVIDYCDKNGIEIIFVFPPMHLILFEEVTGPLGIDADRERYKQFLIARATVYDFEFPNAFNNSDLNFTDSFHLNGDGKKWLIEAIFTDLDTPHVIRYVKE